MLSRHARIYESGSSLRDGVGIGRTGEHSVLFWSVGRLSPWHRDLMAGPPRSNLILTEAVSYTRDGVALEGFLARAERDPNRVDPVPRIFIVQE